MPGEHLESSRRAIRKALRGRGFNSNTHVIDDVLAVWSDDAYKALDHDELGTRMRAALDRIMTGDSSETLAPSPQSTVAWSTWVADM